MNEEAERIRVLDEQARCKDRVFRDTVLIYLNERPSSYIKSKVLEFNQRYRDDKNFRMVVRSFVARY